MSPDGPTSIMLLRKVRLCKEDPYINYFFWYEGSSFCCMGLLISEMVFFEMSQIHVIDKFDTLSSGPLTWRLLTML